MYKLLVALSILISFSCSTQKKTNASIVETEKVKKEVIKVEKKNDAPSQYHQNMGMNLGAFGQCKSVDDFNNLSNKFMRIANAEKTKWLPYYYAAQCKTIASFMEQDKDKKDKYLDEAQPWFDTMIKLAPTESEVYALQSMFYSARIMVNPMQRGQEFSMKSNTVANKALHFDKNNGRAKVMILQNAIGMKSFFGNDISEECGKAMAILESWDQYVSKNPLMPSWGKSNVEGIVKSCEKK